MPSRIIGATLGALNRLLGTTFTTAPGETGTGALVRAGSPTLTGTATVANLRAQSGAIFAQDAGTTGSIGLSSGDGTHSGYIQWRLQSASAQGGTRLGYMGYDTANVTLTLENSAKFAVSGGAMVYGGVSLANSVTGTGSMALGTDPSFTNSVALRRTAGSYGLDFATNNATGNSTISTTANGGETLTITANGSLSLVGSTVGSTVAFISNTGTAIPAGGANTVGFKATSTSNFGVFFGSGAPTLSAAKGSLYLRSDGSSTSTRMYVNTDGATAWTAVTTAT